MKHERIIGLIILTVAIMVSLGIVGTMYDTKTNHHSPIPTIPLVHAAENGTVGTGSGGTGGGAAGGGGSGSGGGNTSANTQHPEVGQGCTLIIMQAKIPTSTTSTFLGIQGTENLTLGTITCSFYENQDCSGQKVTMGPWLSPTSTAASFRSSPTETTFQSVPGQSEKASYAITANLLAPGTTTLGYYCDDSLEDQGLHGSTTVQTVGPITSASLSVRPLIVTYYVPGVGKYIPLYGSSTASTTVAVGDTIPWTLAATDTDASYYVSGTHNATSDVNEVYQGFLSTPTTTWNQTFTCRDLGTYTRNMYLVGVLPQQQGSITTNNVNLTVTDPYGICTPPPPICTYAKGYASSCAQPSNPSSSVVSFLYPLATTTASSSGVTFTLSVNLPGAPESVWNTGYYWSAPSSTWVPFTFQGTPYQGTKCQNPSKGCWLTNTASSSMFLSTSSVGQTSLYVLTYDEGYLQGRWRGPACAGGSNACWRLSVFPENWDELLDKMVLMSNFKDMAAYAENNGYVAVSTVDISGQDFQITLSDPFTGFPLASYSTSNDDL